MPSPTRTVLAIGHVAFEHLGTFEAVLKKRDYAVRYGEAGMDRIAAEMADGDALLCIMGGPIGAYEEERYPWLLDELALIGRRLASGAPMLGICLGAQLIARAMGARVYPGPAKEIGWAPVELTEAGRASPLARLEDCRGMVLHWHGDTFDLPAGASRLASSAITLNQAFSAGDRVLGLQFHVEAAPDEIERWLIGHACEIGATKGVAVEAIRDDMAPCAERLFADWLDRAGL
jgi:GMP synthase (glutamine-hydrolysing)